jgi:hypothetical protein
MQSCIAAEQLVQPTASSSIAQSSNASRQQWRRTNMATQQRALQLLLWQQQLLQP